jgi:hypothetical protein
MAQSKEIAVRTSADLKNVDLILEILRGNEPLSSLPKPQVDAAVAQRQIFERAISAKDDDELENLGSSTPWQDLAGIPVEILGFDAAESEKKDGGGPPIFSVVDIIRLDTGDPVTVTNGSWGVWSSLINLAKRGEIPGAIRVLEIGEKTKGGGSPQKLVRTKSDQAAAKQAKLKERL